MPGACQKMRFTKQQKKVIIEALQDFKLDNSPPVAHELNQEIDLIITKFKKDIKEVKIHDE